MISRNVTDDKRTVNNLLHLWIILRIKDSFPGYQLFDDGNEIPQLVRASISRYIEKLNYASFNKVRHFDEKSVRTHLR